MALSILEPFLFIVLVFDASVAMYITYINEGTTQKSIARARSR